MHRAVLPLAVALVVAIPTATALAQRGRAERAPDVVDAAGMVDYSRRPNFTVGSWAKYHTLGSSLLGHKDDYTVTVLIAGEELWWGEPCFWIETSIERAGQPRRSTASLVSYAAFGDTLAGRHLLWFLRKTINGYTPEGKPDIMLYSREGGELKLRRVNWEQEEQRVKVDSLGADTVSVPGGRFDVFKVLRARGHTETAERGDSTIYYERSVKETYHYTDQVPITRLARIEIDDLQQGKTWLAGQFDRGALQVLERAQGATVLVAYGTSGVAARLIPEPLRRPIDRQLVEQTLNLPLEPPVRTLPRSSER